MLDIIILFFLCRNIGRMARAKGLTPLRWQLFTIVAWIVCEIIGMNLALGWMGYAEIKTLNAMMAIIIKHPGIVMFSLFCAFGGALLVRYSLERKPDADQSGM